MECTGRVGPSVLYLKYFSSSKGGQVAIEAKDLGCKQKYCNPESTLKCNILKHN